ncbi:hypothetical protein AURDEDRAFT_137472 [Auricularia subglabra TFB-10046 SS5]|nr:hypothetical protein AURDEDRAFT_137472 [Auricularia subglabra TFB-10046 SS5]
MEQRQCDNCAVTVSTEAGVVLGICSNCKFVAYCSKECQRAHWALHKDVCRLTAAIISASRAHGVASGQYPTPNLAKYLRRFCSIHASLISWAAYQALNLKDVPENLGVKGMLIEVAYNPHLPFRFELVGTHLIPRTYLARHADPLVVADVQRREERSLRAGGIGCIIILVQCGSMAQVMPVEVSQPMDNWQVHADWEQYLAWRVRAGLGNFIPPTTSEHDLM